MSTIRMPDFHADASLCRSEALYRGLGGSAPTVNAGIHPAFFVTTHCIRQCTPLGGHTIPCASFACECECMGGVYSHSAAPGSCGICRFL
jgi:hypothetical protein